MEVAKGIHLIPGTVANVYLIIESDGLVLIDTGLPGSLNKIVKYLERIGYNTTDIKHIIITHADNDHYGCLARLADLTGAKTYASDIEAAAIARGENSWKPHYRGVKKLIYSLRMQLTRPRSSKIDSLLEDGNCLSILGGLQVIGTPGHTPGHISLYSPSQRILFAGDSMYSNGDQLFSSNGDNSWDKQAVHRSVESLSQLGAHIVCVGHGPVIYEAADRFPSID